jgi:hypothetical protein
MPLSISTPTTSSASSGFRPRRIAISGRFIAGKATGFIPLILLQCPNSLGGHGKTATDRFFGID